MPVADIGQEQKWGNRQAARMAETFEQPWAVDADAREACRVAACSASGRSGQELKRGAWGGRTARMGCRQAVVELDLRKTNFTKLT